MVDSFCQRRDHQFFGSKETQDARMALYLLILDKQPRPEVSPLRRQQQELVRDVSRFYSSSHDRFTYGSGFINFNLPQFYQIVKDGREQAIPFRSKSVGNMPPANQITIRRYYSSIFRDERAGKRGLSGMQS